METFGKILFGAVKVVSLGTINANPEKGKIVFKDPITGTADLLKKGADKLLRKRDEGVWIGSRPIENLGDQQLTFGFSSAALRIFNSDIMHQAVMVDGKVYSLCNDKGGDIQIKEVTSNNQKNKYEWRYRGKTQTTNYEFENMINRFNTQSIQYHLAYANCQDVSDALSKYALGIYTEKEIFIFIFPKADNTQQALLYSVFSVSGAKAFHRMDTDLETIFR
ncbi:hypothetical protein ABPG74_020567 [Tetrahymena malaccensis]